MRKELLVYLNTTEPDIEASLRILKQNNNYVVLDHEGHRFAVPINGLKNALNELESFVQNNKTDDKNDLTLTEFSGIMDVSYGDNNE
jgi:hypothetical protein